MCYTQEPYANDCRTNHLVKEPSPVRVRVRNQDNAFIESKQETAFAVIDAYQSLDNFHLTSTPSEGKGWSCKFCTYSHEKQAEAIMLTCAMCGGERESG